MFRKQLARERISKLNLSEWQKNLIATTERVTNDIEDFYEWIRKASDSEVMGWLEAAKMREEAQEKMS